jgi:hypothetical protein
VRLVLQAMRHSTSSHLHSLTINMPEQNMPSCDFNSWSELDTLVNSPQFSDSLHELLIKFNDDWDGTSLQFAEARDRCIEAKFPLCVRRGILQIHSMASKH